jgi:hypothetical protein
MFVVVCQWVDPYAATLWATCSHSLVLLRFTLSFPAKALPAWLVFFSDVASSSFVESSARTAFELNL